MVECPDIGVLQSTSPSLLSPPLLPLLAMRGRGRGHHPKRPPQSQHQPNNHAGNANVMMSSNPGSSMPSLDNPNANPNNNNNNNNGSNSVGPALGRSILGEIRSFMNIPNNPSPSPPLS